MDKATKLLDKINKINESVKQTKVNIDLSGDRTVDDISKELIKVTKKHYPSITGNLIIKSDGSELSTMIKGEDRIYSILDLDTGEIDILGD